MISSSFISLDDAVAVEGGGDDDAAAAVEVGVDEDDDAVVVVKVGVDEDDDDVVVVKVGGGDKGENTIFDVGDVDSEQYELLVECVLIILLVIIICGNGCDDAIGEYGPFLDDDEGLIC